MIQLAPETQAPRPAGATFFPYSESLAKRSAEMDKIALARRTPQPANKSLNSGCHDRKTSPGAT
jgi:hypothetical protein